MYVLTGGQDDLLSIWSLPDRQIVARCQGHDSWVTAVAFDPWRCDDRNYRFGSVGDDCKLLLWDFSVGMLHRPRGVSRFSCYGLPLRRDFALFIWTSSSHLDAQTNPLLAGIRKVKRQHFSAVHGPAKTQNR